MKLEEVKADVIRQYLLSLEATRNAGGIHASYRAIRAFYSWLEVEFEEEGRRNPMRKVMAPKVNKQAREGASVETIRAMIDACKEGKNVLRDRLIMMVLFDTGMRAGELLALDVEDVDPMSGAVVIQHGKGDKRRVVYLGAKSRKSLRNYLKIRGYTPGALFLTDEGERIKYMGLRRLIERRAINAKVKAPGLHDFRRAFAVTMLRNGCELLKLAELLGHNTLEVTRRYIHLVDEDLRLAHALSGPVDKNL
jgi:site-specific recombinase XerD